MHPPFGLDLPFGVIIHLFGKLNSGIFFMRDTSTNDKFAVWIPGMRKMRGIVT